MALTLDEARRRAALLSDVHTEVHLDLTGTDRFAVSATLRFSCAEPGADTFVELTAAEDLAGTLNGTPLEEYDGERIALPDLAPENVLEVTARLPYVTDGDGMHTMTDPADGERYVSAFTAMDVARRVLPCFDQPDLKTTFTLRVTAPTHWTVLANGRLTGREHDTWSFAPTPPISSYLFFCCGGPFFSHEWQEEYPLGSGRMLPFGWHARASLAAELERDAAELREITTRCFRHYTEVFDAPYPFDDYQQVMTPGLNWGAMEFPGCVAFRDEYLFRGEATAMQRNGRASVIAHEMAHMWFGDLVTMRWWEDTWLNESFADFMGYEVAGRAAGYTDSWVASALRRKPTAYRADARRSTHPIAEDAEAVPDVDTAFGNFDMITYAKGNAVLRQLVTWLGEEDFLAGVNRHLSAHQLGNATLADFLDALDAATDRDVRGWAEAYLRTTGFDTVRVTREDGVPVLVREGSRPHRFTVTGYDGSMRAVATRLVDLADEPVRLDEMDGLAVVPNAGDEAYAALSLDAATLVAVRDGLGAVAEPLTRAVLWRTLVEDARVGRLPLGQLVSLAATHLPGEAHPVVFEGALDQVVAVVRRYADPTGLPGLLELLAETAQRVLTAGDAERAPAAARAFASVSADADLLEGWLSGDTGDTALPEADQDVRWAVVHRLASLGRTEAIDPEAARDPSATGQQGVLRARAAVPTPDAKEEAWSRLMSGELSNRDFEAVASGFWGWEQHLLVEPYLTAYCRDGLDLGRRSGQAFGKVIGDAFPWLPLAPEQRIALRAALAEALAGDVPTVLARTWNDELDDLDLVIAATR